MRRVARPDFVPTLTVDAASKDSEAKDNDDTDSEQSYGLAFVKPAFGFTY
jgi:hypothetical protein